MPLQQAQSRPFAGRPVPTDTIELRLPPTGSIALRTVDLDGRPYLLAFDWNGREDAWYISIYADDADTTPLIEGWRVSIAAAPNAQGRQPDGRRRLKGPAQTMTGC